MILDRALELARGNHSGPVRVESTLNASSFYEHHGFVEVRRATVSRNQVDVPKGNHTHGGSQVVMRDSPGCQTRTPARRSGQPVS